VSSVGTWLSLVERTLGVGEVASSNLVVPTISPLTYLCARLQRNGVFLMLRFSRYLLTTVLFATAGIAHACSCALLGGACGAAKPGGTMFLGEVLDGRTVKVPAHFPGRNNLFFNQRIFRIRVTDTFSGDQRAGEVVEVRTGSGGGDCGFDFQPGKRYFVDAYTAQAAQDDPAELAAVHLGAGICGNTQPEESAGVIVSELRTALVRGRQPDLHGEITLAIAGPSRQERKPLADVTVTIVADGDRAQFHSVSDTNGYYRFDTVPAGRYIATFDLPQHIVLLNTQNKPLSVVIPHNDGTGLACHLSATAGPSGGISGRVMDADGNPVDVGVYVYSHGKIQDNTFPDFSDYTDKGAFSLENLPDGEYDLVFNNNRPKLHAVIQVTVHDGEEIRDMEIRLNQGTRE
jgi:hypothetical protein